MSLLAARDYWSEFTVTVEGRNQKWLKRLHTAGFVYLISDREWERTGLTEAQAKSLVGRMRTAGLKVLLHSADTTAIDAARLAPHEPTAYDLQVLDRIAADRDKKAREQAKQQRWRKKRSTHAAQNLSTISVKHDPSARVVGDKSVKSKPRPRNIGA